VLWIRAGSAKRTRRNLVPARNPVGKGGGTSHPDAVRWKARKDGPPTWTSVRPVPTVPASAKARPRSESVAAPPSHCNPAAPARRGGDHLGTKIVVETLFRSGAMVCLSVPMANREAKASVCRGAGRSSGCRGARVGALRRGACCLEVRESVVARRCALRRRPRQPWPWRDCASSARLVAPWRLLP